MNIFIVDDSKFQINRLKKTVADLGHNVSTANCGENALEVLINNDFPDLIITDLMMPGICGKEWIRKLKIEYANIPVIILSSDTQKTVRAECLDAGAKLFINKPFNKERVSEAIRIFKHWLLNHIHPRTITPLQFEFMLS